MLYIQSMKLEQMNEFYHMISIYPEKNTELKGLGGGGWGWGG